MALIFIDFFPFDMQKKVLLAQHYGCPERFPRYVSLSSVLSQTMQQILLGVMLRQMENTVTGKHDFIRTNCALETWWSCVIQVTGLGKSSMSVPRLV